MDLLAMIRLAAEKSKSMNYRRRLSDFANRIHNVFGLEEQSRECLTLVTKVIGSQRACLLFLDFDGGDFTVSFCHPKSTRNPLSGVRLSQKSPIVDYLKREKKWLTKDDFAALPDFQNSSLKESEVDHAELFLPLVSRNRLFGILMLGKRKTGQYSPDDSRQLQEFADLIAVSLEKEYLREQLSERITELSVVNRSSTILTSSLDIQEVFDPFVTEVKKVIDIGWAAVALINNDDLLFLALSPETGSPWKVHERIPLKDTGTEWVVNHKKILVESDLSQENRFPIPGSYRRQRMRSVAYLPLIAKDRAIGSLIIASRKPDAYGLKQITFLEHVASQIAMPIENSRLYAEVKEQARVDKLTGLFNRRSLDEIIVSEINRHTRYGGAFSLIILDLDSFKAFNDNYGHLAGDDLLRKIGDTVKDSIRNADHAFRYGGDEFAILLPNTVADAANLVAERIRRQIASRTTPGQISVTASLGLANWPANGTKANEVIAAADAALYQAKRSGGNRCYRATNPQ